MRNWNWSNRLVVHHSILHQLSGGQYGQPCLAHRPASIVQLNKGLILSTKCCLLLDGFNGWIVTKDVACCPNNIKQNFLGKLGFQTFLINSFKFAFLAGFLIACSNAGQRNLRQVTARHVQKIRCKKFPWLRASGRRRNSSCKPKDITEEITVLVTVKLRQTRRRQVKLLVSWMREPARSPFSNGLLLGLVGWQDL